MSITLAKKIGASLQRQFKGEMVEILTIKKKKMQKVLAVKIADKDQISFGDEKSRSAL